MILAEIEPAVSSISLTKIEASNCQVVMRIRGHRGGDDVPSRRVPVRGRGGRTLFLDGRETSPCSSKDSPEINLGQGR